MTQEGISTWTDRLRWDYRRTVLALCVLALFVTVFGRLALSPVVPAIAGEFGTSNALIGGVLTSMWLAYALTQFPSGVLADRYGDRLLITFSAGGTGVTALLIAGAPTFWVFAVGTVLLGGVAGFHYSVGTTLLTRIYDDTGTAIGIHNGGAPLAGLVTPPLVSWIAVRHGWRLAVAVTAIIGIPAALLVHYRIRSKPPRKSGIRDQLGWNRIRRLLTRPGIVFTGVIAILSEASWQGIASFLPTFFVQFHSFSTTLAGTLFAIYFVAQGVLQVGIGLVADRLGRDVAIAICALTGIAGVLLLIRGSDLAVIVLGLVLIGVSMAYGPAVFARFMDYMDDDERGFGFGLFRTTYMVVAAPGSVVLGTLADAFDWSVSMGFVAASLVIVLVLLVANHALNLEY